VIRDYGKEHVETGALIVYTSADSVFQIAAHEAVVPIEELYRYCEIARGILTGPHAVGRVIARPFEGEYPNFKRTSRRHDFSLLPPKTTLLDLIFEDKKEMIAIGKIHDIFAGRGTTRFLRTSGNADGIEKTKEAMKETFEGLCFVNLVDFDMMYGHRNDIDGYAAAISAFDRALPDLLKLMNPKDILMITADHGCDPSTPSTDHSRECVPLLIYGDVVRKGVNLHTRKTFSDIAASIAEYLELPEETVLQLSGTSFLSSIL
jgi:phosphopentomutase